MHDGKIAIVNNDPALLALFQDLFTLKGHAVTTYIADDTTHTQLRAAQPRLIVLDVGLQQSTAGWPVLKLLQFDPTTQHIPVLVTSVDHRYIRDKATMLQAIGYDVLELPAPVEVLFAKVEQMLTRLDARHAR